MGLPIKVRNFVLNLRNLSENKKRFIFFTVIAIVILVMGFFEIILTKNNIATIGKNLKQVSFPKIDIPAIDSKMPSIDSIDINELENSLQNLNLENTSKSDEEIFQDF